MFSKFAVVAFSAFLISNAFALDGSLSYRYGTYLKSHNELRSNPVNEVRLNLQSQNYFDDIELKSSFDFVFDHVKPQPIDLSHGEGFLDIRELYASFYYFDDIDIKLGRQILTWGTGDLLFINDLFPKDWRSFAIGRDDFYLKAPSDALKASWFADFANVDLVYVPAFDADRYADGTRVSYYSPMKPGFAGKDDDFSVDVPSDLFSEDEVALRAYKNFNGLEGALYYYNGFWKIPLGSDGSSAIFPELSVTGLSIRGNALSGIASIELGYYGSNEDIEGKDPLIPNSELRYLISYEQELIKNVTISAQGYLEQMLEYSDYKDTLFAGMPQRDEVRSVYTIRLTESLIQQKLSLSQMYMNSPSDKDYHLRLSAKYIVDDNLSLSSGAVVWGGKDDYTFYNNMARNNSYSVSATYGF